MAENSETLRGGLGFDQDDSERLSGGVFGLKRFSIEPGRDLSRRGPLISTSVQEQKLHRHVAEGH